MHKSDFALAISVVALLCLYFFTNVPHEIMYDLAIELDHMIPLVPFFIVPYLSYFLIPVTAWAALRISFDHLRLFLITAICILLISHTCFWCFPTQLTLRPEIQGTDVLSQLIKRMYSFDHPYAVCPSLHANMSTLCAIFWYRLSNYRYRWIMILWTVMVMLSTVLMKQHFVLDVVAGIVSGVGAYFLASWIAIWWPGVIRSSGR